MAFDGYDRSSCRNARRLLLVALIAATLPACIQTTAVGDRPTASAVSRQPSSQRVAAVTRQQYRAARTRQAARTQSARPQRAADGLASFYSHGTRTASGEKFNAGELTAAHRTLPFGTRVRVTNVATGQSVTVRVNDRGPFINGRVIDVSHAAAQSLGMVGQGVAKVKLDVVQ